MRVNLLLLISLCLSFSSFAQRVVSGRVTDNQGAAVPGANVILKGTSTGTSADIDGNYRLQVPNENAILVFSFIGLETQEVEVGARTVIDVEMLSDVQQLGEVIVVGYGTQIKQDLTGNIARVSGEEIRDVPVNSVESAIMGRTAGVFIEGSSGKLGEGIKIRVRGSSSLSASNQPLYVVDGVIITSEDQGVTNNQPLNPLSDINFADIESIEILKDASAAAIYGSRAANGVVLITTRRGSEGKTNVNLRVQAGASSPTNKMDWMNAAEYREIYTEATLRYQRDVLGVPGIDPANPTQDQIDAAQLLLEDPVDGFGLIAGFFSDQTTNTDWQEEAFEDNAGFTQIDVSASGGSAKTKFFIGASYSDQQGIVINNDFNRISGRINVDQNVDDKFLVGGGINIIRSELDRVANDNAFATPLQLVALAPTQPAFVDGEPNPNTIYYNGLIEKENASITNVTFRNLSNVYAQYSFLPELSLRTEFGLDVLDQQEDVYQGRITQTGSPGGQGLSRAVRVVNYTTTTFLSYNTSFDDLNLSAVLGTSFQKEDRNRTSVQAIGFPTDDLNTIQSAAENINQTSFVDAFAFLSYFVRTNLKWRDRYLLSLSGRIDGSSKFGSGNQYGFFPAASAGWILTQESFLANNPLLSFLKLRASAGLIGNAPVARFAHLGTFAGANYTSTAGLRPWTLDSPDLKWETTFQYDIGVDFGLLNDRISGEIDYYQKLTSDLLLSRTLPAISGFTSIFENVGELENRGIEIVLNSDNLVGEFSWSTSFNIAFNENKITKLNGADLIANVNRAREGEPLGVFVSREYAGVNPDNGDALYFLNREASDEEISAGDVFTVQHIGDELVTADYNLAQNVVIGDPNPDFIGGLNNNFSYKGIDLGIFFQFVSGNQVYNLGGTFQSNNASGFVDNQTRDQLRRWREPGDITDIPRAELVGGVGDRASSRYLQDASYLRLKTLTLAYNFPSSWISQLKMSKARVFFSGVNLWTLTDYTGWDPEVSTPGTNRTVTNINLIQGTDFYTAPQARTFTLGVEVGF
ncbi:MAG: TonB-dependent receptor [Bacteroidota bacterium]